MKNIAVITGDIINSRDLTDSQKRNVMRILKREFPKICIQLLEHVGSLDFFRGDSFQGLIKDPRYSLRISIILRALLRSETQTNILKGKKIWDCRIGIGIGTWDFITKKVLTSDGAAFVYAGKALDELKSKTNQLQIKGSIMDPQLELFMRFAETIISKWTIAQSKVACSYLLDTKKTQTVLAEELSISQSALNRRFKTGYIEEIRLLCEYFENLIN
ncbi:MAG: SatD family protein [Bacteroidales bacterium]|nr:SatD family protein [Bacteroidales bacterium]MCL2132961.1 SatD family protein [Bacteroidales bacterium]